MRLHALKWVLAAFLAQAIAIYPLSDLGGDRVVLPIVLLGSHLLLVPFFFHNWGYTGIRIVALGLALNASVMVVNGGLMPVAPDAVQAVGRHQPGELQAGERIPRTKNVLLHPGDTRLRLLSDVLIVPLPKPATRAVSIGDLFIIAGAIWALVEAHGATAEAWRMQLRGP